MTARTSRGWIACLLLAAAFGTAACGSGSSPSANPSSGTSAGTKSSSAGGSSGSTTTTTSASATSTSVGAAILQPLLAVAQADKPGASSAAINCIANWLATNVPSSALSQMVANPAAAVAATNPTLYQYLIQANQAC